MKITQEIVATIAALEDRRGRLTAEQVVEEARPQSSPLHGCFEWDDSKAAESWRIEQARDLIKRVKIVVEIEDKKIRVVAYVRDSDKEATQPGYRALMRIEKRCARAVVAEELERVSELLDRAAKIAATRSDDLPRGFADKIEAVNRDVKGIQAQL
jgi:hypothetical protein